MQRKKFFSTLKKLTGVVLAAAVMMSVMMLSGCSERAAVDFSNFVKVNFSGIDGSGYAKVDFNRDDVYSLLGKVDAASAETFVESLKISDVENNGDISNGDTITLHITLDQQVAKKAKIAVTNTDLSFEVKGLDRGIAKPDDITDDILNQLEQIASNELDEHIQKLVNSEKIPQGEVTKEEIAKAVTNSDSIGYGIEITMPSVTNVKFQAAYTYEHKTVRYEIGPGEADLKTSNIDYFTVMMFSAEAEYSAHRDAGFLQQEFNQSGSGNYIFAVYMESPLILADGSIKCNDISVKFGGVSEEAALEAGDKLLKRKYDSYDELTHEKAR